MWWGMDHYLNKESTVFNTFYVTVLQNGCGDTNISNALKLVRFYKFTLHIIQDF